MFFRLYVCPNEKLQKRFPAIDKNFIYVPKPVSVGQTDVSMFFKYVILFLKHLPMHIAHAIQSHMCSKVPA